MLLLIALLYGQLHFATTLQFCDSSPTSSLFRVVGGYTASASEHSWQAVLVSYDTSISGLICGATIVDEYWILTAAHCIVAPTDKAYILTGLTSLSNPKHTHHVEKVVMHPEYDAKRISNDVALVKSQRSLYNDGISNICLTRNDSMILSSVSEGIVTGFGLHIVSGSMFGVTMGLSDVVLQTSLPIIPLSKCRLEWSLLSGGTITISDNQLCAGSKLHGTGPGDSGGPLLTKASNGKLVQIGITSFGAAGIQGLLDQNTYPGVYARVSSYASWIEAILNGAATSTVIIALLCSFAFFIFLF